MKTVLENVFKSWCKALRDSEVKENTELAELIAQIDVREKENKGANRVDNVSNGRGTATYKEKLEEARLEEPPKPKNLAEVVCLTAYRKKSKTSTRYQK